jgi:hypothetical protein
MSPLARIITMAALGALMGCTRSTDPVVDGSVSETTNGIVARVVYPDGEPCADCAVRLRAADYVVPAASSMTKKTTQPGDPTTDARGRFNLPEIDAGTYVLEITDRIGHGLALRLVKDRDDTTLFLGTDTIRPLGCLQGTVANPGTQPLLVQLAGLEHSAKVNLSDGSFRFAGLPAGGFGLRFASVKAPSLPADVDSVEISSADTTRIAAVNLLPFSRVLTLNTAPSGAGVSEDVVGFPLLVRLNAANFDFSQAQPDGSDLRFFRKDQTPLPYEIERWDAASGIGEIWVRLDTIFGNDDSQSLQMLWGELTAGVPLDSAAVFDTVDGFQGVWHLNEAGISPCFDATPNRYTGTPYRMNAASAVAGAVGIGRHFEGDSAYFQMHGTADGRLNFAQDGAYAVSAWVRIDSTDTLDQMILSKGHEQYYLNTHYVNAASGHAWEFVEYHDQQGWQTTSAAAHSGAWKYLVGIRNGTRQYLYIDGVLMDSSITLLPGTISRTVGNDLTIGRYIQAIGETPSAKDFSYFNGTIDEVRISSMVCSPAWIRLCYMNQRADDRLISYR